MKIISAKSTLKIKTAFFSLALALSVSAALFPASHVAAACAALPTDKGTVTSTISVPTAGTYRVWSRIMAPDTTNNSYLLQIDQSTCGVVVGDSASIPANTWTWVDYSGGNAANTIDVALTAGTHTITMAGREAGVKLDRVEVTTDLSCVPAVGTTGDNCATVLNPNATPDLVVTSVGPTTAMTGSATKFTATVKNQGTAATPAGKAIRVGFSVDGTLVTWSDTDTTSLAAGASVTLTANNGSAGSANWTAVVGSHTIQAYVDDLNTINELDGTNNTLSNTIVVTTTPPPTCTTAPSVPTGLNATATTDTTTTVSWTASTPGANCTIGGYQLYLGGTKVADIAAGTTSYLDSGLTQTTTYSYTVTASDTSSHTSAASAPLSVTTSSTVSPPPTVPGDADGDGVVNTRDIATIVKFWNTIQPKGTNGDLDKSGKVDTPDITILIHYWPH